MHSESWMHVQRSHSNVSRCPEYDERINSYVQTYFPRKDILYFTHKHRPIDHRTRKPEALIGNYLSHQLPILLKETEYNLQHINKIFAASWVTDRQVVFGTKCNKVGCISINFFPRHLRMS